MSSHTGWILGWGRGFWLSLPLHSIQFVAEARRFRRWQPLESQFCPFAMPSARRNTGQNTLYLATAEHPDSRFERDARRKSTREQTSGYCAARGERTVKKESRLLQA